MDQINRSETTNRPVEYYTNKGHLLTNFDKNYYNQ